MPIDTVQQRTALAAAYAAAAPFGALFSADPGATGAATGELTGGTPAYARKALNWTAAANSATSGTGTFDVASGATVGGAGVCASVTAGTADVRDAVAVPSQPFASQGQYTLNTTYTQS